MSQPGVSAERDLFLSLIVMDVISVWNLVRSYSTNLILVVKDQVCAKRKLEQDESTEPAVLTVSPQERPRPEFAAMAPTMEQNPVTGVKEPYFPEKTRLSRMFTGSMVIIMMVRHCLKMYREPVLNFRCTMFTFSLIYWLIECFIQMYRPNGA